MTRFINTNTPQNQRKPGDVALDFVGPSYQLVRKKADTQRLINMATTAVESGSGKSRVFLQSIPGLKHFSDPVPPLYYFQSLVYPSFIQDTMNYSTAAIRSGFEFVLNPDFMHLSVPALTSGSLSTTIAYTSYTNQRDIVPDSMLYGAPAIIQSGSLSQTIRYVSYLNQRDVQPDGMTYLAASIRAGSLVTTIQYVGYANQREALPDTLKYQNASIQSGSLT